MHKLILSLLLASPSAALAAGASQTYPAIQNFNSIKSYGAACDGQTDDTAALKNAINDSCSSGKIVQIPCNCEALLTSTITISCRGLIIQGCGYGPTTSGGVFNPSTLIKSNQNTGDAIYITSDDIIIQNLNLVAQQSGSPGGNGIHCSAKCTLEHVSVSRMFQDGIRIGNDNTGFNANSWALRDVQVRQNGRYGLYLFDQSANCNAGVSERLWSADNSSDGVHDGCQLNTFLGTLVSNSGNAIYLQGYANQERYLGGDLEGNPHGIVTESGTHDNYFNLNNSNDLNDGGSRDYFIWNGTETVNQSSINQLLLKRSNSCSAPALAFNGRKDSGIDFDTGNTDIRVCNQGHTILEGYAGVGVLFNNNFATGSPLILQTPGSLTSPAYSAYQSGGGGDTGNSGFSVVTGTDVLIASNVTVMTISTGAGAQFFTSMTVTDAGSGGLNVVGDSVTASALVSKTAYFGSAPNISTFSAAGALSLPSGTTITANGPLFLSTSPTSNIGGFILGADNTVSFQAGASTTSGRFPITVYQWVGSSATAASASQQLLGRYVMPPNLIANNNDELYVLCESTDTSSTVTKTLAVQISGASAGSSGINTNSTGHRHEVWISRASPGNFNYMAERHLGSSPQTTNGTLAFTESNSNNVDCLGTSSGGVAGDITLVKMKVILSRALP